MAQPPQRADPSHGRRPGRPRGGAAAHRRRQGRFLGPLELRGRAGIPRRATAPAAWHTARGDVLEYRSRHQGGAPVPAVGGGTAPAAHGPRQRRQPRRRVPPSRAHAAAHPLAASQDHPDAGSDRDPLRGQRRRPADLHGRPSGAAQRRAALVVRLLARLLGRRHAGGREHELPRSRVAGRQRRAAHVRRAPDRALPPANRRASRSTSRSTIQRPTQNPGPSG